MSIHEECGVFGVVHIGDMTQRRHRTRRRRKDFAPQHFTVPDMETEREQAHLTLACHLRQGITRCHIGRKYGWLGIGRSVQARTTLYVILYL